jgi:hypothetical protein
MVAKDRDARIRAKAYELWEKEGRPSWQHERHWDDARFLVEQEEALEASSLKPVNGARPDAEPAIAFENQGEFPTLTDQGDSVAGPTIAAFADPVPMTGAKSSGMSGAAKAKRAAATKSAPTKSSPAPKSPSATRKPRAPKP